MRRCRGKESEIERGIVKRGCTQEAVQGRALRLLKLGIRTYTNGGLVGREISYLSPGSHDHESEGFEEVRKWNRDMHVRQAW